VASPTLIPEGLVAASDDGNVYLIRVSDGREIRSFSNEEKIRAPLISVGSSIYLSDMGHILRSADLEDGFWRERWCYNTKEDNNKCD